MSTTINGHKLADQMQAGIQKDVERMTQQGIRPGLVVLLVGEDPASQTYVRNKEHATAKIGVLSKVEKLPETISEEELLAEIDKYNQDSRFHDILIQLSLPKHIDKEKISLVTNPKRDVDRFHPVNLDHLLVGRPEMIPCTPYGIMKMFEAHDISLTDKRAVVIGRSNIAGKPVAQLLLMKSATVTTAHSKTEHLVEVARETDILAIVIGHGHPVTKELARPDAIVIDVDISRNQKGRLIGDVVPDEVSEITSYITPVPKGVGPMTITMLTYQIVEVAKEQK